MNKQTETITLPAAENISTEALAAKLAARVSTSVLAPPAAAPAVAAAPQTAAVKSEAEIQPTEEQAAAATPDTTESAANTGETTIAATEETTTETATEKTPEAAAEDTAIADDDKTAAESEAAQPVPKAVKDLRSRVHKVVDQRDAARAEADTAKAEAAAAKRQAQELTQQVQQLREGTAPNLITIDQFSGHPEVQPIDARLAEMDNTIAWCEKNPAGGDVAGKNATTLSFTADQVEAMKAQATRDRRALEGKRTLAIGKISAGIEARTQAADDIARKSYPWLANQQSPEFQMAIKIGKEIPGLLNHPEFVLHIGDLVRGRMEREAAIKKGTAPGKLPAKAKTATTTPPPNLATSSASAPRVTDPQAAALKAAEETYRATHKFEDLQKLTLLRTQQAALRRAAA